MRLGDSFRRLRPWKRKYSTTSHILKFKLQLLVLNLSFWLCIKFIIITVQAKLKFRLHWHCRYFGGIVLTLFMFLFLMQSLIFNPVETPAVTSKQWLQSYNLQKLPTRTSKQLFALRNNFYKNSSKTLSEKCFCFCCKIIQDDSLLRATLPWP